MDMNHSKLIRCIKSISVYFAQADEGGIANRVENVDSRGPSEAHFTDSKLQNLKCLLSK